MADRLYIIGNGFDLHHGIKSSYWAFGEFLRANDPDTFEFVERYFDTSDDFWSNFEERLAFFDAETLIEDASAFLVGYPQRSSSAANADAMADATGTESGPAGCRRSCR